MKHLLTCTLFRRPNRPPRPPQCQDRLRRQRSRHLPQVCGKRPGQRGPRCRCAHRLPIPNRRRLARREVVSRGQTAPALVVGVLAQARVRDLVDSDRVLVPYTADFEWVLHIFDSAYRPAVILFVSAHSSVMDLMAFSELGCYRTIQFVGMSSFHTRISDPVIGGTYMTVSPWSDSQPDIVLPCYLIASQYLH